MEKKQRHKILIAGAGTSLAMLGALQLLENQGHGIVVIDEEYKTPEPPKLPEIKMAEIVAAPTRKQKKDKTHLKRYSSYFNKKSQ